MGGVFEQLKPFFITTLICVIFAAPAMWLVGRGVAAHQHPTPQQVLQQYAQYGDDVRHNKTPNQPLEQIATGNAYHMMFVAQQEGNQWSGLPRPGVQPFHQHGQSFIPTQVVDSRIVAHYPKGTPRITITEQEMLVGAGYHPQRMANMVNTGERTVIILFGRINAAYSKTDTNTDEEVEFMGTLVNDNNTGWRVAQLYPVTTQGAAR